MQHSYMYIYIYVVQCCIYIYINFESVYVYISLNHAGSFYVNTFYTRLHDLLSHILSNNIVYICKSRLYIFDMYDILVIYDMYIKCISYII